MPTTPPSAPAYVQSLEAAAAKAVAATSISAGWVQWMELADPSSAHRVSVLSYANANPLPVALVDTTGAHLSTFPMVGSVQVTGTVVASIIGTPSVAASVTGQVTVTASVVGVPTFTGSVQATQATSPWAVMPGSTGATFATVASIQGTPAFVGSVQVTQASSPWVTRAGSSGAVHLVTGSVAITPAGSLNVGIVGTNGLLAGVSSYGGDGNLVRVDLVRGTLSAGADGALLDGTDATIKARVASLNGGGMLYVFVASQAGGGSTVTGSVVATQGGAPWSFVGSAQVTQASSPWVVLAGSSGAIVLTVTSVIGQPTVTASIAGTPSVVASVIGVPTFVGSVVITPGGSLSVAINATSGTTTGGLTVTSDGGGNLLRTHVERGTVVASVIGTATTVTSVIGQPTITASVVGVPTFVGSVVAAQGGAPWTFTGSATVTPAASWSVLMLASSGTTVGPLSATSNAGGALLRAEVVQGSLGVSQLGSPWGVVGSVGVTPLAVFSVTGTVVASVIGQPTVTASLIGQPTVTASVVGTIAASISGTVVSSVIGQVTVTASVAGTPSVVASVIGNPTVVASVIGQPTVTASIVGVPTFIGSVGATQLGTWSAAATVLNTVTVQGSVYTATAIALVGMRAIATTCTSVLAHPYDGAAAQVRSSTAAGSVTFYLASDVWTGDLRGFAVMFASSGNAQGVVRTIASVSNSLVATVDSPWETGRVPHSGQVYKLLIDCRNLSMVTIATEMSSSTANLWGTVAQYTVPQSGAATAKPWMDRVRIIDNLQTSLEINQASYWQMAAVTLTVRGAVGAKYLVTSVTGGSFCQWAGAS